MHHPQRRGRRQHHQKDEAKQHRPKRGRRRDAGPRQRRKRRKQHDPPRARRGKHDHQTGGESSTTKKEGREGKSSTTRKKDGASKCGPSTRGEERNTTPVRGGRYHFTLPFFFVKQKALENASVFTFSIFKMCEQYTDKYSTYRVARHDQNSSREHAWLKSWRAQDCTSLCP